jgi:hypothetical protein
MSNETLNSQDDAKGRNSQAHKALELARQLFTFCSTETGEPVAVSKEGVYVALQFTGRGVTLRSVLAEEMYSRLGLILSDKAFKEVSYILSAEAQRNPTNVPLRIGKFDGNLYVDLGGPSGQVIEISQQGWQIRDRGPIPFLRTVLTVEMPRPAHGGDILDMFDYVNVPLHRRDLFLGCLVASFFDDIPHPVLNFDGEQGSGKSFAAELLTELLDPSLVPRRKPPKDIETWTTVAQGSYIIGIDNVRELTPFFSDAVCRAVTGDGNVSRELYTNGGLFVSKFRRFVVMNGIGILGIQEDLRDRLISFKFPVIPNSKRRTEQEIIRGWEAIRPGVYGSLLDLVSRVLTILPSLEMDEMPRMADFSRVLAAMDKAIGTDSLNQYLDDVSLCAASSVSEDPIIEVIQRAIPDGFYGSSKVLLEIIHAKNKVDELPGRFPDSAKAMSSYLSRICPTLRKAAWLASDEGNNNHQNVTLWRLAPPS